MENLKLAFLSSYNFENDSVYRGAVLVTDENTKPIEFRVTSTIKPTDFQKTLYGSILNEHILVELIAVPLLGALKDQPDFVLVQDPLFLAANDKQGLRIVRLFKETEGDGHNEAEQATVINSKYEPILLETSKHIEADLVEIRKRLFDIFAQRNLLEPFDRVKVACQQIHDKKVGE